MKYDLKNVGNSLCKRYHVTIVVDLNKHVNF